MKRRFIVVCNTSKEIEEFKELVARCISSSLMLSHGLREEADLIITTALDNFSIHFVTHRLRGIRPDEASLCGILHKVLLAKRVASERSRVVQSGVIVSTRHLKFFLIPFSKRYICHTSGLELRNAFTRCEPVVFVVPLHPDVVVNETDGVRLRTPVEKLWPDQVITLLNISLDRVCGR